MQELQVNRKEFLELRKLEALVSAIPAMRIAEAISAGMRNWSSLPHGTGDKNRRGHGGEAGPGSNGTPTNGFPINTVPFNTI